MTDKQPEEMQVPLYELLEDIPEDFRIGIKDSDNWSAGETWHPIGVMCHQAAAELRRLHEVNAELVEALKFARETAVGWYDDSRGFDAKRPPVWLKPIDAAIAKATGEQQ
jgi:hypothetical protein